MPQQLEHTQGGVATFRCDLRIAEPTFVFSPAAAAINGLAPDVAHPMVSVLEIQHPDDRGRVVQGIADAQHTGLVVVPHRIHRADNHQVRELVATIRLERDATGRPRGVRGQFVDVTEQLALTLGDSRFRTLRLGTTTVLCVAGAVDMLTRADFAAALHNAAATSEGDLYLDASHLEFIDLDGVEILIEAAEGLAPERRLVCVVAPHGLVTVVDFLRCAGVTIPPSLAVPTQR